MCSLYQIDSSSKKILSTHGKSLLLELDSPQNASLAKCIEYVKKDPYAGLLKEEENGNNSFHILVGSCYKSDFVLPLLRELLQVCPTGARVVNSSGALPLHLCLSQQNIIIEAALLLLDSFPKAASIPNGQRLLPLFLSVMRNNPSFELSKALCKAYPAGPSVLNSSNSYPLHFAANRERPNKDILRMLIRRNPDAARHANNYGSLPLHCICSSCSDDVEAVRIIYEANPAAIQIPDRQGKTCLHLATLAVGKDHSIAVEKEEEDIRMQTLREREHNGSEKEDDIDAFSDGEENDGDTESNNNQLKSNKRNKTCDLRELTSTKSRAVIRYLIHMWPRALVTPNNFFAIPVETVLEKTKPMKTKYKKVSLYGLFNDPPTARLLLYSQYTWSQKQIVEPLKPRLLQDLKELNWQARRNALFVSYNGNIPLYNNNHHNIVQKVEPASKSNNNNNSKGKNNSNKSDVKSIPNLNNNILAKLRRAGFEDCVRQCILWL